MKRKHEEVEDAPEEMKHFYFENGLRKVRPYEYHYQTYAKGRWLNRTIEDVFLKEFADRPPSYYVFHSSKNRQKSAITKDISESRHSCWSHHH